MIVCCKLRRNMAALLIVFVISFLCCSSIQHSSVSFGPEDFLGRRSVMRLKRERMDFPEDFYVDEIFIGSDHDSMQSVFKKRIHIQVRKLMFLNIVFHMVFFPILLYRTSIRLFGRCLTRLWNVVSYIHKLDTGEIPLLVWSEVNCKERRQLWYPIKGKSCFTVFYS